MKVWISILVIYSSFFIWYTDLGGKLNNDEIQSFLGQLEENALKDSRPLDESMQAGLKVFMEQDSGKQFIMVNNLDMSENPTFSDGSLSEQSADDLMNQYMKYMYPELFKRASHPVFFASVIHSALDVVGIDNAKTWDTAALFRYKSRRAFMEIVTNPNIKGSHEFKIAALDKTIAYPVEPQLYLGDPRIILGFLLLIIGLLLRPITRR